MGIWAFFGWPLLAALFDLVAALAQGNDAEPIWSARLLAVMLRSVGLSLAAACLGTALGAWLFRAALGASPRWQWAMALGLLSSFCLGTVLHLLAWRVLVQPHSDLQAWLTAAGVLAMRYAPLAAGVYALSLRAMDRAELEAALVVGGPKATWRLFAMRARPVTGLLVCGLFVLCFGEGEVPPLLGLNVYAEEFMSQVALAPTEQVLSVYGLPFMVLGALGAGMALLMPRTFATSARLHSTGWPQAAGGAGLPFDSLSRGSALVLAYAPVVLLLAAWVGSVGRWPSDAAEALLHTLAYGLAASLLACTGAWLAVEAILLARKALLGFACICLLLLFWPSVLTALPLVQADLADAVGPHAVPVLAHAMRIFPYAALLLLGWRLGDSAEREQQLAMQAPSLWRRARVVLPYTLGRWVAVVLLGVCVSLAELSSTVLTVPPGVETVILRTYNLMHYGDRFGVISLALLQTGSVIVLALSAMLLARRPAHV